MAWVIKYRYIHAYSFHAISLCFCASDSVLWRAAMHERKKIFQNTKLLPNVAESPGLWRDDLVEVVFQKYLAQNHAEHKTSKENEVRLE